jgi:DNA invertase Pin-like site-specific DNA recombinase
VCADMPDANELTIHIFARLAQHERKVISERTKRALAAIKSWRKTPGRLRNGGTLASSLWATRMAQEPYSALARAIWRL